jgi:recombination protein RecA
MRVLAGEAGRNDVLLLFTNQEREKIGVVYGSKNTTPGGRALRFYSSIRLELRVLGSDKEKEIPVAIRVKAIAKKNKTAPPLRTANYTITFGHGIDNVAGLFDLALESNVIEKSGAWYNFGDTKLGHGKGSALELMRNDASIADAIRAKIQEEKEDVKEIKAKVAKRGRPPKKKDLKENKDEEDISVEDV